MQTPRARATGLRLIIAYKVVRGSIALTLSLVLGWAALHDGGAWLRDLSRMLHQHFMGAWGVRLARLLGHLSSPRHLEIGAGVLGLDGLFTLFEAWALRRGFHWARWLVIIATASLLPFEVFEVARHAHVGRVLLLAANVGVVLYLIRRHARDDL